MAIPRDELLYWFDYDPHTGLFRWKRRPERGGKSAKVGDIAGSVHRTSGTPRRMLWLKGRRMYAGRAAYVYVHGEISQTALVDHIDGDTMNDRIYNLRIANRAQNTWNRLQKAGVLRKMGVARDKRGRWKPRIQLPSGEKLNLGTWETEAEAHAAYMGAAAILHGEFWVGLRENDHPDWQKTAAEAY